MALKYHLAGVPSSRRCPDGRQTLCSSWLLGALEAGLVAGLTLVGTQAAPAVTAVLVFRVVTYWLPVLPGAAGFWALRRAGSL